MSNRVSEIANLRNLGTKTEKWLNEIGIYGRKDLERFGSVEIYRILKNRGYPASLNLVYAIEAALMGIDWRELPPKLKAELKSACQKQER